MSKKYGDVPADISKRLAERWQKGRLKGSDWPNCESWVKWAYENGYQKSYHLGKFDGTKPHGPDNSFFYNLVKKLPEGEERETGCEFCRDCKNICPGHGNGCSAWRDEPFILNYKFSNPPEDITSPLSTITAVNSHYVAIPYIMCNNAENLGRDIQDPVPTITTGNRNFLAAPTLIQYHSEQSEREHRGQEMETPLQTVDAANRYGLVGATLVQTGYGEREGQEPRALDPNKPLGTVVGSGKHAIAAATMIQFNNNCDGLDVKKPLPTITSHGEHFAEVRAMLIKYYGVGVGQSVDKPLDTITAKDRFGLVTVAGVDYQIVDIGLRMLTPRELYNAQGFPPDYEIEVDCYGNAYPKKEQVARCGNSVPPAFATALVRANWAEACGKDIKTMAQLNDAWAV